jgi:hypothetical protein
VPATATIRAASSAPTALEVGGTIAFAGTATNVWYTIATPFETGMVQLFAGAHIVDARSDGDEVVGSVVMYSNDVMQGEDKHPEQSVDFVRVPCTTLTLDWIADDFHVTSAGDGSWWRPTGGRTSIGLRSIPKLSAPTVSFAALSCEGEGCVVVERLETRGEWLRVGDWGEAAYVTGWVRRSELVKYPDDGGRSYMCFGDHHGEGFSSSQRLPHGVSEGPARLKVGTTIFAEPGKGAWATVTRDDTFTVRYSKGESWAQLTEIPGISGASSISAYVPISAVIAAHP